MNLELLLVIIVIILVLIFLIKNNLGAIKCPYCKSKSVAFLHQEDMAPKRRHVASYRVKDVYSCQNCKKTFGKNKTKTLYHGAKNW